MQWDLKVLLHHWEAIKQASQNRPAPFLIHQESDVIVRAIRDYLRRDIGEILIDSPKVFEKAKEHIKLVRPDFINRVKLYQGEVPLFSHYQIESQIESAFQREVRLPSGGSIVIDVTEALTAIDINSARSTRGGDIEETALNTNLEAADEIARQLRLRDLGGLVVIDFIDMTPVRHQREVENRIRDAVRQDRARIQISRISRFGLLEMSRQRLSPSLGESSHHICPRCQGTGKVRDNESLSLSILRLIEEEALKENTKQVHTIVPVQIASYLLNEKRKAISNIEKRHNVDVIVAPNEAMETPHFSVFRLRDGEEVNELSYNLAKIHCEKDESTEESLVSRNVETTVVAEQPAVESAAVALSISEAAPTPVERKSNEPSLLAKIIAKIKGLFASESEENKSKNNRTSRNSNRNQRRPQDRRTSRRPRSENNETERTEEQVRNIRERNQRRPRRNLVEESIAESAVNSTPVFEAQDEKTEQVTQRRQRRDLRKRVRVEDNEMAVENNESIVEQMPEVSVVEVQAVQDDEKPARQNQERSERQDRQRRTPRHLRAANNQRRRRNQEPKSPMPLFAAVASPELASGKAWVDYSTVNAQKENNFLSVDELLEQEKTKKGFITPAMGIVVEEKSLEVKPALDFITQPANESVQKKVQESLERLNSHKPQETVEFIESTITLNEPEIVNEPAFVRTYEFNGRLGTISSVTHTKAEMILAKASDEMPQPFPIMEWQDSRYYFYGKGAAGHHCAISHVYSEPTRAKSE